MTTNVEANLILQEWSTNYESTNTIIYNIDIVTTKEFNAAQIQIAKRFDKIENNNIILTLFIGISLIISVIAMRRKYDN